MKCRLFQQQKSRRRRLRMARKRVQRSEKLSGSFLANIQDQHRLVVPERATRKILAKPAGDAKNHQQQKQPKVQTTPIGFIRLHRAECRPWYQPPRWTQIHASDKTIAAAFLLVGSFGDYNPLT